MIFVHFLKNRHLAYFGLPFVLLILALLSFAPQGKAQTVFNNTPKELKLDFEWSHQIKEGVRREKTAILIPVRLDGIDMPFYLQFDTGSASTLLYAEKINALKTKGLKIDISETNKRLYGKTVRLNFGNHPIDLGNIRLMRGASDQSLLPESEGAPVIIGTLGMDFIKDKGFVLNYPGQSMMIYDELPQSLSSKTQYPFTILKDNILLPVKINEDSSKLIFDTGSSLYFLLTNKASYQKYRDPKAIETTAKEKSFSTYVNSYTSKSDSRIEIAGRIYDLPYISTTDAITGSQNFAMGLLGIKGITGNVLFLNNILIFDMKRQSFAIVDK